MYVDLIDFDINSLIPLALSFTKPQISSSHQKQIIITLRGRIVMIEDAVKGSSSVQHRIYYTKRRTLEVEGYITTQRHPRDAPSIKRLSIPLAKWKQSTPSTQDCTSS